jgi:hypothetical protein
MNMNKNMTDNFNDTIIRLRNVTDFEACQDPYEGLRVVKLVFKPPYVRCTEVGLISLAIMRLLIKYAYQAGLSNGKFTIGYEIIVPTAPAGVLSFTVTKTAISLKDSKGNPGPNMDVLNSIMQVVMQAAEDYEKEVLSGIFLRIYYTKGLQKDIFYPMGIPKDETIISEEESNFLLSELITSGVVGGEPQAVKPMGRKHYPDYVTALPARCKDMNPFIVADTETVIVDDIHVPYAAGYLIVYPGEDIAADVPQIFFSEDSAFFMPEFKDRSRYIMSQFIESLGLVARRRKIRTVYLHNLSRFDGILLLKHYASHDSKYTIKPLMRNLMLYELGVYQDKKLVLRFRDSLTLLPSSLNSLARTLCPQLGSKGSIPHEDIRVDNLSILREQLVEYLIQDIRLLGGVMQKAQYIYYTEFQVDILGSITLSALAMRIYRTSFYDPNTFPIHIPSRNEDTFIRRGYYGGHADSYIPYGKNLYYYDVNSLYPFVMKEFNMPSGKPVWNGNLEGQDLSNLYGFIEAYVVCPRTITRPFLPYRDHNDTLLFPTGRFVGVYYSEELKYAKDLGYRIIPLKGYLFEEKPSPFASFVSTLFAKRKEAREGGNDAMAYVYKILMNSLYGRFGIKPESTTTVICDRAQYDELIQKDNLIWGDRLSDHTYIVNYLSNASHASDLDWNPPKISAVQIAAAITACARIHMYKYIGREDCYYTDTDSAILGSPLPEDEISMELGKLKLEHFVKEGIFLGPKLYGLDTDGEYIVKHKGLGKHLVDYEWFKSQYADLSRTMALTVERNFNINWRTLEIEKTLKRVTLGTKMGSKRDSIFDNNKVWVNTQPKDIMDFGGHGDTILKHELMHMDNLINASKERVDNKEEPLKKDEEKDELMKNMEDQLRKKDEQIEYLVKTNESFNARMDSMSARLESLIEMNARKDEQIEFLVKMNEGFNARFARLESLIENELARKAPIQQPDSPMNEGINARFARLESLIENELARKAPIQQPDSPKFTPSTGSPRHGYKMKSDKKLRREQRRRNKHSKKAPPP